MREYGPMMYVVEILTIWEGRAAAYYWKYLFGHIEGFTRDREGIPPNNLLNYGLLSFETIVATTSPKSGMLPLISGYLITITDIMLIV